MKKIINKILFLCIALFLFNCEDAPLDRGFTSSNDIGFIEIVVEDDQIVGVDPEDDSGLPTLAATETNKVVKFSSSNNSGDVVKRIWRLPDPALSERDDPFSFGDDIILEGATLNDEVERSFARANRQDVSIEFTGYPIILIETLANGNVLRYQTNLTVRKPVKSAIVPLEQATIDKVTTVNPASFVELGLASTDFNNLNQTKLTWSIDESAGYFVNGTNEDGELIQSQSIEKAADSSVEIVYKSLGEQEFTMKVQRFWPVPSMDTQNFKVNVVSGLVPNGGTDKDPIKLSSDGRTIRIRYTEVISDISSISVDNFELNIDTSEVNQNFEIGISSISLNTDIDDPTQIVLQLTESIPSVLMDNVTLSYDFSGLKSENGISIDTYSNFPVSQTATNLLADIGIANFEDTSNWDDGGFFFPNIAGTDEMGFSTEQSFDGVSSFFFDTKETDLSLLPNNSGTGAGTLEGTNTISAPAETGDYRLSMWVYVDRADVGTAVDFFLLDFAFFTTGSAISALPVGKWVKVSGIRSLSSDAKELRPYIRVVKGGVTTGNVKIFIDQIEIRRVDDGR